MNVNPEEAEVKSILKDAGFSYEERLRYIGKVHKQVRHREVQKDDEEENKTEEP